ncbi:LytR C-terminal domain-containing protein [Rhodococcus artemisiae]|uniref:LytR C-terminal domain-containing protein n=1 Tax=Rhodococcus artemisiae TaxID=714159 RepID=A0ABU7LH89_9NOCA|nr:LytR C-terminal domain-containing protein [Rhodococcus artemisiae]MEE2060919.1 LytR C-terminal domain-containing protein [Rhodococcus artemisiae]
MVEGVSRTAENANRGSSGLPLRAIAMLLISLAILFAGLGFASLGGSDDDAASTAAATTETTSAAPAPATAPPPASPAGAAGAASAPAASETGSSLGAGAAGGGASDTESSDSRGSGATASSASVRVYNNSNIAGLAAQTATLLEDEGFTIAETGNYSEGLLTQTSVYYGTGSGEQETAESVAGALGVTAQPRFDGIADSAPGVIVIVAEP